MTEAPGRSRASQSPSDEEIAAAVGAALAQTATTAGVAPPILLVLPSSILILDSGRIAALIASEAAAFAVREVPKLQKESDPDVAAEFYEELTYRALYVIAVARRFSEAIRGAGTFEERRRLVLSAVKTERRYFAQHLDARKRRSQARKRGRDGVAKWGEVVSWVHGNPKEPRPTHLAADGRNWRPALGPPLLTSVLPGVLPECTCEYGPPREGVETMAGSLRS